MKLLKQSLKPGEVTVVGTEIAKLQPLDDKDVITFKAKSPYMLIVYFYSEGEVLRGHEVSISVGLENLTVSIPELEAQRQRIAFLRKAAMEEVLSGTISHLNSMQVPVPVTVPYFEGYPFHNHYAKIKQVCRSCLRDSEDAWTCSNMAQDNSLACIPVCKQIRITNMCCSCI